MSKKSSWASNRSEITEEFRSWHVPRASWRYFGASWPPGRRQEPPGRLQEPPARLQEPPRCRQDAFKTPSRPPKTPPRAPKTPPRASKMLPRHAKSLPVSKISQRCLSAVAKHDGRLSNQWPLTNGGLAVVRPRRASSIRQTTLVSHGRVQNKVRNFLECLVLASKKP